MAKSFWQRDVGTVLRWIAVIPAAFAAYFLSGLLKIGLEEGFLQSVIDSAVRPVAAIWIGSALAPSCKTTTAIVLASAQFAFIAGFVGYLLAKTNFDLAGKEWDLVWIAFQFAISIAASVATCIVIHHEENRKRREAINFIIKRLDDGYGDREFSKN